MKKNKTRFPLAHIMLICTAISILYPGIWAQKNDPYIDSDSAAYDPNFLEDTPVFPGCEDASTTEERNRCFQEKIIQHINKNFHYPNEAKELSIQGRIIISFIIEKDSSVSNITVVKSVHELLDREGIRVMEGLPRMKPGTQNGKPVRVRYNVPIVCRIVEDTKPGKNKK